jgi:hypothetical protein
LILCERMERGRRVLLKPRPGETAVTPDDPRVADVAAAFTALWPEGTRTPAVTFYASPSAQKTPAVHVDTRGVAVVVPEGFEDLWWRNREVGRAMLAHEIGHILQEDVRLWTGLDRAVRAARVAAPIAWAELVVGTIVLLFTAFKPTTTSILLQAAAFWALALTVAGLRWVITLGPHTLALSELMADHFAALTVSNASLLSAIGMVTEPPEGHHLPLARRRAALAEGASPPWEEKIAPTRPPWSLLAGLFVASGLVGYVQGAVSDAHVTNAMLTDLSIRRRGDGTYVLCLVEAGGCTVAWDPEARDFVPADRVAGVDRTLLTWRVARELEKRSELSVVPVVSLLRASTPARPVENDIFLVLGAAATGYLLGHALGWSLVGDSRSWWAAGRMQRRDTWERLTAPLVGAYVGWSAWNPTEPLLPWVDYQSGKKKPSGELVMGCWALRFDTADLRELWLPMPFVEKRTAARRSASHVRLRSIDLEATLLSMSKHATGSDCRRDRQIVELEDGQLDVLLELPDDPHRAYGLEPWMLVINRAGSLWCDPDKHAALEEDLRFMSDVERRVLRERLVATWAVPPACAP